MRDAAGAGVREPVPVPVAEPLRVSVPDALGDAGADAASIERLPVGVGVGLDDRVGVGEPVDIAVNEDDAVSATRVGVELGDGVGVGVGVGEIVGVAETVSTILAAGEPELDGVALGAPTLALCERVGVDEGDCVVEGATEGVAEDAACAEETHETAQPPAAPTLGPHTEPRAHFARAPRRVATHPAAPPANEKPGAQKARMPRSASTHSRAGAAESAALGPQ